MLLRRTFTELQQRSQHLPKHLRLKQDEFMMDPSISEQLQKQLADKVRERERVVCTCTCITKNCAYMYVC